MKKPKSKARGKRVDPVVKQVEAIEACVCKLIERVEALEAVSHPQHVMTDPVLTDAIKALRDELANRPPTFVYPPPVDTGRDPWRVSPVVC